MLQTFDSTDDYLNRKCERERANETETQYNVDVNESLECAEEGTKIKHELWRLS